MKIYFKAKNGYMVSSDGTFEHRDVWESAHGPIPADCHIHHRNRVRHDNRIENLECIEKTAHLRMHGLTWAMVNHLRKIRDAQPVKRFSCAQCGKETESNHPRARFCSRTCAAHYHNDLLAHERSSQRAMARGMRTCPVCEASFVPSRLDQKHCSRRCTSVSNKRQFNARIGHTPTPSFYRV